MFNKYKRILSIIAFLAMTFGLFSQSCIKVYAQTTTTPIIPANTSTFAGGFTCPIDMAVAADGSIYVSDVNSSTSNSSSIKKIDSSGTITTVATGLSYPTSIALDGSGNIYVVDNGACIKKITSGGSQTVVVNDTNIWGVTVNSKGDIYYTSTSGYIKKVSSSNYSGTAEVIDLSFLPQKSIFGITVDRNDNIYFAEKVTKKIYKINNLNSSISPITITNGIAIGTPKEVKVDNNNNIYVLDNVVYGDNGDIFKIAIDGNCTKTGTTFYNSTDIALDANGENVYVTDSYKKIVMGIKVTAITTQPTSQTVVTGGTANFSVGVSATGNVNYQWKKDGTNIDGATLPTLSITNAQTSNSGTYTVEINSAFGTITSTAATLAVSSACSATAASSISAPIAGEVNPVTLTVNDSSGNIDTSFNGSKNVTISGYEAAPNDSYGSYNGNELTAEPNTISVNFTDGVATSGLVLNKAQTQNINFTIDGVNTPSTNNISISPVPAAVKSMDLTQNITAPASNGGQFVQQPIIELKDTYGNVCTNDNVTQVTAAKNDGGTWTLTGATAPTVVGGRATFSDLGATNVAEVTGAQLEFNATGCTQIKSGKVNLLAPAVVPAVNSVTVDPATTSVVQGQTKQLTATVSAVGGAAETVDWLSIAPDKVRVDQNGLVSVAADAAPGIYRVSAVSTVDSSKTGTATITVTAAPVAPAVNSVTVDPATANVVQGQTKQLTATVSAVGGAAETVDWLSIAPDKVRVDQNGLVSVAADAVPGIYRVSAVSTVDSSKTGTATIIVTTTPVLPTSVEITRADDILTAELKQEDGSEFTTSAAVTYKWYSDGELIETEHNKTYTITNDDKGKDITVKVEQYNLESESYHIDADEPETTTPASVKITRDEDKLIAQLEKEDGTRFTTSSQVTYEWYSDGDLIEGENDKIYTITNDDKGKDITVKVEQYDLESDPYYIDEDEPQATTSSVVLATGSLGKAGDEKITDLTAGRKYKVIVDGVTKYVKEDGILSTIEADVRNLIGTKITGLTNGTTYDVKEYKSHTSSSHKSKETSKSQQIKVDVTDGSSDKSVSQTVVDRTAASDGTKKDDVTYTKNSAQQTIEALNKEGKDVARIVVPDAKDEVSEAKVNIPADTLATISKGNVNLEIDTENARLSLPKESIQGLSQNETGDLYFRLVPIKDEKQQEEIKARASQEEVIKNVSGNSGIQVVGRPMTIETNISQRSVDITLPLKGVTIPSDPAEREAFLKDLGIFIEHSDGEKVLARAEVVEYESGVLGLKFTVNKFSTFTIVKLNQKATSSIQTGWKKTDSSWYFIKNDGTMATGWHKAESGEWTYDRKDTVDTWFHLDVDGKMNTGWFTDTDGSWYFLCDGKDYGALGAMEIGWKFIDGTWYFLKDSGAMATGWQQVNGKWYYLYSDGAMASNIVIDGCTLNESGTWVN